MYLFQGAKDQSGRLWTYNSTLDKTSPAGTNSTNTPPPPPSDSTTTSTTTLTGVAAARAMFQSKTSRGQDKTSTNTETISSSLHSRAITGISVKINGKKIEVTTSSLDGKIILWDAESAVFNIGVGTLDL